jgi:octaprenyl-diphosphate synthase
MNASLAPPAPRTAADLFAPIAADLDAAERILGRTVASSAPGVQRLVEHLSHYRGKRLRPTLLLLIARACGRVTPAHHTLAAVVEMIHTATLVHDDVLDGATLRRHVATVNSGWGTQASILLGDYLFTHAFHLASSIDARACRLIGAATNRLCAGELHQVVERGNLHLDEEAYFAIIDGKTASLTACCAELGAIYSGADEETVERLESFGRSLGLAFQIADDLLDLVGEERAAGKSLGTDLEQQKLTLPMIHFLANSAPERAHRFRTLLQSSGNHKREVLAPELAAGGAIAYARGRAEHYAARAAADLECLPESDCKDALLELTRRVVNRDA